MKISVKLFANLMEFSPVKGSSGAQFILDLPAGSSLNNLILHLGIPAEEVKICFVNGIIRDADWVLQEGDETGIFPPIGGG